MNDKRLKLIEAIRTLASTLEDQPEVPTPYIDCGVIGTNLEVQP
jgi:hypothetical protein